MDNIDYFMNIEDAIDYFVNQPKVNITPIQQQQVSEWLKRLKKIMDCCS